MQAGKSTWWVSCEKFTVRVDTENGRITKAAPICKKFIGQDLKNLLRWADGFGGLSYQDISYDLF